MDAVMDPMSTDVRRESVSRSGNCIESRVRTKVVVKIHTPYYFVLGFGAGIIFGVCEQVQSGKKKEW
jgi:hypothetical protein